MDATEIFDHFRSKQILSIRKCQHINMSVDTCYIRSTLLDEFLNQCAQCLQNEPSYKVIIDCMVSDIYPLSFNIVPSQYHYERR